MGELKTGCRSIRLFVSNISLLANGAHVEPEHTTHARTHNWQASLGITLSLAFAEEREGGTRRVDKTICVSAHLLLLLCLSARVPLIHVSLRTDVVLIAHFIPLLCPTSSSGVAGAAQGLELRPR